MLLLIIALLSAFVSSMVVFVVFLRNRSAKTAQTLMGVIISSSAWVVCVNIQGIVPKEYALWLLRLAFVFVLLTIYFFLLFVRQLVQSSVSRSRMITEILVVVLLAVFSLGSFVISDIQFVAEGAYTTATRGPLYLVVIGGILLFLASTLYAIATTWKKNVGLKRAQLLLVLIGLALGALSAVITNVILPNIVQTTYPSRFAFISIIIWTVVFVYAIVRHEFMNIRLVFARTVGYGAAFGVLALTYALIVFVVFERYIRAYIEDTTLASFIHILFVLLAAVSFSPLKRLFDKWSDSLFYKDAYDSQEVMNEINAILVASTSVDTMAKKVAYVLRRELKTTFIFLYIANAKGETVCDYYIGPPSLMDEQKKSRLMSIVRTQRVRVLMGDDLQEHHTVSGNAALLSALGAAASFRVRANNTRGALILGYKQSGNVVSKQDVDLLNILTDDIAIAIQNIIHIEEISQFNETLSEKIGDATKQLRVTNKKLRAMDQTKDEFISLTSHQLRTPLTTVKGYISMLLDGDAGELTPMQRQLLEEAFNSSQRMAHLISDFLNISRLQTGRFEVELAETNLSDVLDEEIELVKINATSRGIKIEYVKPTNFPSLKVDENKMRQVMMNFIDNAIYYSPTGSSIRILLTHSADVVEFRVIDQGIGVPAAEQRNLFAKFSRASNAKKQRPDGTGIGLFMAKKVIIAHGGAIIFESKENKGSTFGFRLNR